MPAYNREKYIAESIESALRQSFRDFELIIIDDGSTDSTLEIARRFASDPRVRIVQNESNLGIARTRNKALELARADYVAPLDSDDVWLDTDKLRKQVDFLNSHPDCALVGGAIIRIDPGGRHLDTISFPTTDSSIRKVILRYNPFAQSSLMYRKDLILKCGGYDPTYKVCDDYALWLNVGERHALANLDTPLCAYRIHVGNITRTKRLRAASEILEIVRAHATTYPRAGFGIAKAYLRLVIAYVRT